MARLRTAAGLSLLGLVFPSPSHAQDFRVLEDRRPPNERPHVDILAIPAPGTSPRTLIAGDSWAQLMWDDGSHNDVFDRFGHADKQALSRSLASNPGPGYTGPEYAISGSLARHWTNTANYPWIANLVAELEANPDVKTVVLSIGGNDVLAGKSGGGWYKDMNLDVPGSEAAFFAELEANTFAIVDAALAVRPDIQVMISSYDYPNFNVGFWCFLYACPKRQDLSRDPVNDLITDAELNEMIILAEQMRIDWSNSRERVFHDNAVGLMHHAYGDGVSPPGVLPKPGFVPPDYSPFPGGNPLRPSLRQNFRRPGGIDADPIHLDFEGYQYKITHQTEGFFWPSFRGEPSVTLASEGINRDGWTDGTDIGTGGITIGDDGARSIRGIVSFDTSPIPDGATVTEAHLYLIRDALSGSNPWITGALGDPVLDVAQGSFGSPALEAQDATAAADHADAAWFHGSIREDFYALRIELKPEALPFLHDQGLTQFRISFPGIDAGSDHVTFRDGDAPPLVAQGPLTLAEILGSSVPFLDVTHDATTSTAPVAVAGVRMLPSSPNPFRGSTRLFFEIPRAARVRVAIYDVAGRRVATVLDAVRESGLQSILWSGREDSGREVSSGVYFARLTVGEAADAMRLVRLRSP